MRMVEFEDPIWPTIQGEGILVGMPSVFVRFWGCDYACSWCDTKKSWQEGSKSREMALGEVVAQVRSYRLAHVVLTGGNPVLQEELPDLILALRSPWGSPGEAGWSPGMHVTVETQASVYDEIVARWSNLLSLSPKLHDWPENVLWEWLVGASRTALGEGEQEVQVKVVVDPDNVPQGIAKLNELSRRVGKYLPTLAPRMHYALQPESSRGRQGVDAVRSVLERWHRERPTGQPYPWIRVLPQMHKGSLFVR